MGQFNRRSLKRLSEVHPDLQRLFFAVVEDFDCTVLEGHRSIARQRDLYAAGKSKIDGIKHKGKHNYLPSLAVDVTPYPVDFADIGRHREFGRFVRKKAYEMGIPIRWGGDWDMDGDETDQKFNDLVHFELVG